MSSNDENEEKDISGPMENYQLARIAGSSELVVMRKLLSEKTQNKTICSLVAKPDASRSCSFMQSNGV